MKKTYLFPLTRTIDLSLEVGSLGGPSQLPIINPDGESSDDNVDNEGDVLTKRQGIWGWGGDK